MRVVRQPEHYDGCTYFGSASECAGYLSLNSGKVLLTTGSKDLDVFASVRGFKERMYPRVLPAEDSLRRCLDLGYLNKNIICMQGPFTRELNRAMLNQIGAACMVTKETAAAGGYGEKVEACRDAGVSCLVISMPAEKGLTMSEAEAWLRANIGDNE